MVFRYEHGDHYDDHGWLQLVVGKFTVRGDGDYDDSSAHIEFCMEEVDIGHWKVGLLMDRVRIEPKPTSMDFHGCSLWKWLAE